MSTTAIQDEVLRLPAPQRAQLIDRLWASLSSAEVKAREAAWAQESERRIDALEAGQLQARDAQSVFSGLRRDVRG